MLKKFMKIEEVCDSCETKWNKSYGGIMCKSPEEVLSGECENIYICIDDGVARDEIRKRIIDNGKRCVSLNEIIEEGFDLEFNLEFNLEFDNIPIFIYGELSECEIIDTIIENKKLGKVEAYVTNKVGCISEKKYKRPVISTTRAQKLAQKGEAYILSSANRFAFNVATRRYFDESVLLSDYFYILDNDFGSKEFAKLYRNTYRTGSFQFLITKNCNLNCKACTHFAPLEEKKVIYDFNKFKCDLRRLRALSDGVDEIGIWGGEALLCPNLENYIYEARKVFPDSRIVVGTNGILVTHMNENLLQAFTDCDAMLAISLYPPTINRIEEIKEFLDSHHIRVRYPSSTKIESFFVRYDLKGNNEPSDSYAKCVSKFCTTIFEGKLGACYFPLIADTFNKKFEEQFIIDDNDIIDLYDESLTKEKLFAYLRRPLSMCRYCGNLKFVDWTPCNGKISTINDWVK